MIAGARYGHTNLIAKDWRALAGFGHIAFVVDDVPSAREAVLAAGGRPVGEVVTLTTTAGSRVTWVYVTDPEANVIELQSWSK